DILDVPVSSQWQSKGHLYPIQIAQFGLSHWSRSRLQSQIDQQNIYQFQHLQPNKNNQCSSWYQLPKEIPFLQTYIQFTIPSNSSLHFHFMNTNIELVYTSQLNNDIDISSKIIIPLAGSPRQVRRHMLTDIKKSNKRSLVDNNDLIQLQFCGQSDSIVNQLIIGNQTLYDQQTFYSATQWLLNTQDMASGCWFIHVQRNFGQHYRLRDPWCSAMAQGQAASLLVRLYALTNNSEHLLAIRRAVRPLWSSNFSRAYFKDKYLWLEEYPLEPPAEGLFVLNGCLYALLGIIDANTVDRQPHLDKLINEITHSIVHMLPNYVHPNISNWSAYDLSHLTMKNKFNAASYSYHLVHITLLQCLSQILNETHPSVSQVFHFYAQRFMTAIS
ncbi:unnamed protein product, partial [Adineta ricciae]